MNVSPETLRQAAELAETIQAEQARLNEMNNQLNALLGGAPVGEIPAPIEARAPRTNARTVSPGSNGRNYSPEGREAIRQAQIKRWAKIHKEARAKARAQKQAQVAKEQAKAKSAPATPRARKAANNPAPATPAPAAPAPMAVVPNFQVAPVGA